MHWSDFIGYLASVLVVLTFYMDQMIALRITAVLSNIAFLAYGISLELGPVVVLHGVLLPLNIWRLRQLRQTRASRDVGTAPARNAKGTTHLSGEVQYTGRQAYLPKLGVRRMLKSGIFIAAAVFTFSQSAIADNSFAKNSHYTDQRTDGPSSATDRAVQMFQEIVGWLSSNFELPSTDSPPTIAFASQIELMKLRTADRAQWQGFKYDDDPSILRDVVAVYDTATSTIYLPLDWLGASPADQSVLVHEMVHHLQNTAKLKYECPGAREKIAYLAQDAWLKRSDLSLEDEFGVDMFTVIASSACM